MVVVFAVVVVKLTPATDYSSTPTLSRSVDPSPRGHHDPWLTLLGSFSTRVTVGWRLGGDTLIPRRLDSPRLASKPSVPHASGHPARLDFRPPRGPIPPSSSIDLTTRRLAQWVALYHASPLTYPRSSDRQPTSQRSWSSTDRTSPLRHRDLTFSLDACPDHLYPTLCRATCTHKLPDTLYARRFNPSRGVQPPPPDPGASLQALAADPIRLPRGTLWMTAPNPEKGLPV